MIEKISGRVAYAVMSFGGFFWYGYGRACGALEQADLRYEFRRVPDGYPRAAVQLSRAVGLTIGTIVTDNANYTTITTPILLGALPKESVPVLAASLSATFNQIGCWSDYLRSCRWVCRRVGIRRAGGNGVMVDH